MLAGFSFDPGPEVVTLPWVVARRSYFIKAAVTASP